MNVRQSNVIIWYGTEMNDKKKFEKLIKTQIGRIKMRTIYPFTSRN